MRKSSSPSCFGGKKPTKQNKTNCFENAGQPLSGPESKLLCGFLIQKPRFTCCCYLNPQDSKTRGDFCRPELLKILGLAQPEPACVAWFILSCRSHNNEFPLLRCSYLLTDMGAAPYARSHAMACPPSGSVSNALSFQRQTSLHLLVFLCL